MCHLCEAWEKGEITSEAALKVAGEIMKIEDIHHLAEKILEKEVPVKTRDLELDETWWQEMHKGET